MIKAHLYIDDQCWRMDEHDYPLHNPPLYLWYSWNEPLPIVSLMEEIPKSVQFFKMQFERTYEKIRNPYEYKYILVKIIPPPKME